MTAPLNENPSVLTQKLIELRARGDDKSQREAAKLERGASRKPRSTRAKSKSKAKPKPKSKGRK